MGDQGEVVFDSGPLSHFAAEGWLGVLRAVLGERVAVIPDTVEAELERGALAYRHLEAVLHADWIERRSLVSTDELDAFGLFSSLLVSGDRNLGEAGVLAYAKAHGALAIIDDGAGRKAAATYGVACSGTLALLCESIQGGLLTVRLVSHIADRLMEGEYRLPFGPGGFERWAGGNGLV